jgi:hypothetical protein
LRSAISKVATLSKHATPSLDRKMLEKKARDKAIAEHLKTKKTVDKLLSKSRRNVKTVDGYREKAMVSSGNGADIHISLQSIVRGVKEQELLSETDALQFVKFVKYNYLQSKAVKQS